MPPAGASGTRDRFAGRGISYIDAVKMWPTNEPAIDFTIVATLLFERVGALG